MPVEGAGRKMINIVINGISIQLEKPVTVLEAAKMNGIHIPHFCHHPLLELWGGCRMCLVEIEKVPRLQTSCTLYVTEGMKIRTESEAISAARKAVLEFLLINHPLDCPVCDKAGECKLQDYTMKYGPTAGRFTEGKRKHAESLQDPLIVRNTERCILCTRCVRMCDGVQGASALAVTGRGGHSVMQPYSDGKYDCEYCGNCLTVCPVGAVMSRLHRYSFRQWQVEKSVQTVCSFCGVGCTMLVQVRGEEIKRVMPVVGLGLNRGLLCSRGRFGYEYVESGERLRTPLVKKNGRLLPVSWEEALDTAAQRLSEAKERHGGPSVAAVASARCTNEENYLLQKLMRAGCGSNNIDSAARMGFSGAQRLIEGILGEGSTANPISGIANSDAVLVVGGDPSSVNPVLGIEIRGVFRKGAKVLALGHMPGLSRHSSISAAPAPRSEGVLAGALVSGVMALKGLPGENQDIEERLRSLKLPSPDEAGGASGVAMTALGNIIETLKGASAVSIVIGRDVMNDPECIRNLALLAYLLKARVHLMSERPNEQGLLDVGSTPDMLPGGRPVEVEGIRRRCEEAWGAMIPAKPGLTLMEMIDAAWEGSLKAMYVMGENPAFNFPDSGRVKEALGKLDLLIVQDIFMTETAEMADIVFPALGWTEKEGTYTNLERRIQLLRKAVRKDGLEDWRILSEIGRKMGLGMNYESAEDIMKEIGSVSPVHSGLTYEDIGKGDCLWPYKGRPLTKDFSFPETGSSGTNGSKGGLYIVVEKPLFHSGTLSRRSPALNSIYPEALIGMSAETARALSLNEGDSVRLSTGKGSVSLKAKIDADAPGGALLVTNNFRGKGAMGLFGYKTESLTKAPLLEAVDIRVQKE